MSDRLYRSTTDRVISGVCGGLADRFDLDPALVRVAWVVLGLLTGIVPLLVLYIIMAAVVPEEPLERGGAVPGAAAPDAASPAEPSEGTPPAGAGAATAWRTSREIERAARRAARRAERQARGSDPTGAIVVGVALIAIGAFFLLRRYVWIDWDLVWPGGIIALGVLLVARALLPRQV